MHNIDYTSLKSYKDLTRMSQETTGKIQAKRGVLKFSTNINYVIYQDGRVTRISKQGSTQLLIQINELSQRTKKDYDKAFIAIANNIKGIKRKSTSWKEVFEQTKTKILRDLFTNKFIAETIANVVNDTILEHDYWQDEVVAKWRAKPLMQQLVTDLKERGILKKGRDYE